MLLSTRVNWRVENKSSTHFSRGETGHLSKCLKSDAPWTGGGEDRSRLPVQHIPGQTVTNRHVPTVEEQIHLSSLLFPETIPTCQSFGHKLLMDSPDVFINKQQHLPGKYLAMLYDNFTSVFERAQIHSPRSVLCKSLQGSGSHLLCRCSTHLHCTGSQIQMTFMLSEKI